MHFELRINGKAITEFSAVRQSQPEVIDDVEHAVYEWSSWRPTYDENGERRPSHIEQYTTATVAHLPSDGIEELALRILECWSALRTTQRFANSPAAQPNLLQVVDAEILHGESSPGR